MSQPGQIERITQNRIVANVTAKYKVPNEDKVKTLVVDDKWLLGSKRSLTVAACLPRLTASPTNGVHLYERVAPIFPSLPDRNVVLRATAEITRRDRGFLHRRELKPTGSRETEVLEASKEDATRRSFCVNRLLKEKETQASRSGKPAAKGCQSQEGFLRRKQAITCPPPAHWGNDEPVQA